jgi:hypothetical protein
MIANTSIPISLIPAKPINKYPMNFTPPPCAHGDDLCCLRGALSRLQPIERDAVVPWNWVVVHFEKSLWRNCFASYLIAVSVASR